MKITSYGLFTTCFVVASLFLSGKHVLAEDDYTALFKPLPSTADNPENPLNPVKIKLGMMLYLDPRLSKSGFISCNSCHNLATAGVDNLRTSIGHSWQIGPRNAPTVLNAAIHIAQFWDGRAKDVEEQAKGPILNPKEMAASEELVIARLKSMPLYAELFKNGFPDKTQPLNYTNVAKAIAAFERTLLTPSRFDDFLKGNKKALQPKEKEGLKLFVEKGCAACHNGAGVGGGDYKKFDYGTDQGRYTVTNKEEDRMVFRIASLRNVSLTYPYFHDGEVWSLKEAIRIMAKKQLNTELTDQEVADIAAFLGSLTAKKLSFVLPQLPASTDDTPKPAFN
ncbi:MAG: cytochrome-c peroxidase [Deltaproteobacteria bacterium]|nr:cytochrome-c peroxidase [Deltaproteobacteria bacterium]